MMRLKSRTLRPGEVLVDGDWATGNRWDAARASREGWNPNYVMIPSELVGQAYDPGVWRHPEWVYRRV